MSTHMVLTVRQHQQWKHNDRSDQFTTLFTTFTITCQFIYNMCGTVQHTYINYSMNTSTYGWNSMARPLQKLGVIHYVFHMA